MWDDSIGYMGGKVSAYLDGEARMYIFACRQTVHAGVNSLTIRGLRGKTHVVIDELAPLHQHVRVDVVLGC